MNARELLEAYATEDPAEGYPNSYEREQCAPAAFAALRAVLDELDALGQHHLFAAPAFRLRTAITTALEGS